MTGGTRAASATHSPRTGERPLRSRRRSSTGRGNSGSLPRRWRPRPERGHRADAPRGVTPPRSWRSRVLASTRATPHEPRAPPAGSHLMSRGGRAARSHGGMTNGEMAQTVAIASANAPRRSARSLWRRGLRVSRRLHDRQLSADLERLARGSLRLAGRRDRWLATACGSTRSDAAALTLRAPAAGLAVRCDIRALAR
jgi:hypothetical protein